MRFEYKGWRSSGHQFFASRRRSGPVSKNRGRRTRAPASAIPYVVQLRSKRPPRGAGIK